MTTSDSQHLTSHLTPPHPVLPAVVVVKPFGCFVEFSVDVPQAAGGQSQGQGHAAPLVGLVHSSEVSWDPLLDIMRDLKVGGTVSGWVGAHANLSVVHRQCASSVPRCTTLCSLRLHPAAAAIDSSVPVA